MATLSLGLRIGPCGKSFAHGRRCPRNSTDCMFGAIDFRWIFDMGGGMMEAYIKNSSGSELSASCRSGGDKDVPKIYLESDLISKTSDEDVQFIVDKKTFPITFTRGIFDGTGRLAENAVWNLLFALKDAHSSFFTVEYPSKGKSEQFSILDVRENLGGIIESCY
jgi:hypothetical protein